MDRLQVTFSLLVLAQAAHSVEEYGGRLYDLFPPARIVSAMVSYDVKQGFVVFNSALVMFGVVCIVWLMRSRASAQAALWLWVGIELLNGIGHPVWSLVQGGYTPGVATAPVLLVLAISVAHQLLRDRQADDVRLIVCGNRR